MIIAISGASGFVGQALKRKVAEKEWILRIINRESISMPDDVFVKEKIEGADVVINLAGASIAGKWTPEYKKEILDSRVVTTRKIAAGINQAAKKPALLISASAIGIYSSEGTNTESEFKYADTFLAGVCQQWEDAAMACAESTRVVIFRLGVVLGRNGGMLSQIEGPFRYGAGGKLGNGRQPFSFIHLTDLVDAMIFAIEHPGLSGVYNAVSPFPVTNAEFTNKLGKAFRQPAWLTVPAFALKLVFGEGAQTMLEGQRVLPERLQQAGFRFQYPTLQNVIVQIYRL